MLANGPSSMALAQPTTCSDATRGMAVGSATPISISIDCY
jgi:hypothetical protein